MKFIINFLEILKKQNPHLPVTIAHKNFAKELYEYLFINKNFEKITINTSTLNELKEANVNLEDIFNKLFLILANSFIKHVLKEKNSIHELKKMSSLLEFYIDYISYYIKEPIAINSKLPKEIKEYFITNKKVYIFNVYKGVPIANSTTIHTLNEEKGTIEVSANYYQIVASKFQKEIYILEPNSNKTFKAFIQKAYPQRKTLELFNIEKVTRKTPKRNYIRVQPKEDIIATIKTQNGAYETIIYDISLKGCALLSNKKIPIEIGDFVKLSFTLNENTFNLEAELKSITKLNKNSYRYHFYFEPNPKEETLIEKYITTREKEIVKELQIFLKKEIIE
jgi:hypothetical protein